MPIGSLGDGGDPWNCSDYVYGTEYLGNFEYTFDNDCGNYLMSLDKIYNSEGYCDLLFVNGGPNYQYYRKDHLGNNREVWNANGNVTYQRTQYYPSGLPWAESTNTWVQSRKYNGKEFVETHGLDEYDSSARWFYPAIMRTTTLDPLAEKYYSISPYAWCGNNPVSRIDPDGMDWLFSYKDEKYIWRDDINAKSTIPDGYKYIGSEDQSILTHMGIKAIYETKSENNVDVGVDGEELKGAALTGVSTKVKADITITTNVSYKEENASDNNKDGKSFEGVTVTASVSERTNSSSDEVKAKSYGVLTIEIGDKKISSGLKNISQGYFYETGTKPTTGEIRIPSSAITSTNYLKSATVRIGDPNPNMIISIPVKLQWNLQTRTIYRPINKK